MKLPKLPKGIKIEWSKFITVLVIAVGFIIIQECLFLMYYSIKHDYTATAAWLTAAVGLAEAVIGLGVNGYLSLCKSDHSEGGITFEMAKSRQFIKDLEQQESCVEESYEEEEELSDKDIFSPSI